MKTVRLGELLTGHDIIDTAQCDKAIARAQHTKTRLGDVLVAEGMLGFRTLYETIAIQHGLPFTDLLKTPPDKALLDARHIDDYLEMRCIPFQKKGVCLILATAEYSDATREWAAKYYGEDVEFVITSPLDIRKTIQAVFAGELRHESTMKLFENAPESSALSRTGAGRKIIAMAAFGLLGAALATSFWTSIIAILAACHLLYAATMLFKLVVYAAGLNRVTSYEATAPAIRDADLPVYTVLIPMYKETESMPHLLSAMHKMDYPASKLDIKLVLEEDDDDTLDAAYALKPRYQFDIIRVPPGLPRTKPKACNYALRFARGEFVTIYDADDRPDPQQLRKAVAAFRSLPDDVICLQARLNYYNVNDNLLTRLFSLEYAMLFHVLLYGMSRLSMPILLGGTSNHIYFARLKQLGEWDPFNVTEDADLGTRLAMRGFKTAMLDSITMEEAPNTLPAWLRQRSRWIKGYMQTWLVHMRRPASLYRGLQLHGFLGFQFFVALSSFSYLTAPVTWIGSALWLPDMAPMLPQWLYALGIANLGIYLTLHVATALHIASLYRKQHAKMMLAALTYPFYLVLHSVASYPALWQLVTNPYAWNKTSHGMAKTFSDFQLTDNAA
ncbi:MAG: glycosyltransferase [Alphaproteobacteria bacterium]|nr:glycosyltransferase [Alphaproteobacteria bacterium]